LYFEKFIDGLRPQRSIAKVAPVLKLAKAPVRLSSHVLNSPPNTRLRGTRELDLKRFPPIKQNALKSLLD